jgi:hypothetical protein
VKTKQQTQAKSPTLTEEQKQLKESFLATLRSDPMFVHIADESMPKINCGVWIRGANGRPAYDLPCIAVGMDDLGNWSVLTYENKVRQFLKDEVL